MGAIWAKVDALLPMNPRCFAAGFMATTIYSNLLLLNKAHGRKGKVSVAMASPEYLVRYLQIDREFEAAEAFRRVKDALRACVKEGLIALEDDGIQILGWSGQWSENTTSTERTRKWREKQRDAAEPDGDGGTAGTGWDESDVGTSRLEENRLEENRSEYSGETATGASDEEPKPKGKAKPKALDPDSIPERAHLAAQVLADYVRENNPDGNLAKMTPAERVRAILKSADQLRIHSKKHEWATIDAMIAFSQRDKFWAPLVHDGARLRKHWDTMAGQRNGNARGHDDVRVGRVEPAPHSAHEGGEVQL